MLYKTIIQGKIEFGNQKAYDMALKMYQARSEKYYKNDLLFEKEDIFFPDSLSLIIPRFVKQSYDKSFKNTSALLEYIVQFGLAGEIDIWQIGEKGVKNFKHLEPNSDKVAVQQYIKGKSLVKEKGKETEAITALTKAIEKYDRHAQAYERRGRVNLKLKKYHDALRDYNKCLALDPDNPYAYFGKALVHIHNKEKEQAIEDMQQAIKKSVALQTIHWKARRLKGKLHLELKQFEKAQFELKLFANRKFKEKDQNLQWKRQGHFLYGQVLLALKEYKPAIEQFEMTLEEEVGKDLAPAAEVYRYLGMTKQQSGKKEYLKEFLKDIKEAASMGDKPAAKLLKEFA